LSSLQRRAPKGDRVFQLLASIQQPSSFSGSVLFNVGQRFAIDGKIERRTVVDQAAQQIRAMIADGRLPQGERLPEIPLSEALGVSRNTVRDGLRMLISEGLVIHEVNRGAVVRVLGGKDIRDIYGVRRILELEAIREVSSAPPDLKERSHNLLSACGRALAETDYSSFVEHELDFHAAIVAHLCSERIDRFFSYVLAELRLIYSNLASDDASGATHALLEKYQTLYEAAEGGDVVKAQEILGSHLDTYEARTLAALREEAPAPQSGV
jgi:DNA-binding GntR family transcriptional regulator